MSKPVLKINEAIDYYNDNKPKSKPALLKLDLAKELFKGAKEATIPVNMSNLVNGKTSRVSAAWVKTICDITGVDANFLFNTKPMKKTYKNG